MVVQTSEGMEGVETEGRKEAGGGSKEEEAVRLLRGEWSWFLQHRRADVPELLHTAAQMLVDQRDKGGEQLICRRERRENVVCYK